MMDKLDIISDLGYSYYFQFTVTPYNQSIEKGLRNKDEIVKTFCALSDRIGKDKVFWRYDPIILNDTMDIQFHREQFERLCNLLCRHTTQCTISFVDLYSKLRTEQELLRKISDEEMITLCRIISSTAKDYGILVKACCEKLTSKVPSLSEDELKIEKAHCIDKDAIEKICGYHLSINGDKNQREGCGCIESVDIGIYNTCKNGCIYCYANYSAASIDRNCERHDPSGELLMGTVGELEKVTVRKIKSHKKNQLTWL